MELILNEMTVTKLQERIDSATLSYNISIKAMYRLSEESQNQIKLLGVVSNDELDDLFALELTYEIINPVSENETILLDQVTNQLAPRLKEMIALLVDEMASNLVN